MMIRRILETDGIFRFENGGELPSIRIAYYCSDREYRPSDRVIWFCHALTGNFGYIGHLTVVCFVTVCLAQ